jgi:hypothetical protein
LDRPGSLEGHRDKFLQQHTLSRLINAHLAFNPQTNQVATAGYGLSAVCKLLLATVGTALSAIGATVLIDRIGKGIRTAPRDAMISLSTPERQLGYYAQVRSMQE